VEGELEVAGCVETLSREKYHRELAYFNCYFLPRVVIKAQMSTAHAPDASPGTVLEPP